MKCILGKCPECYRGMAILYCRLRSVPVTSESFCRIDQHIEMLKQRVFDLTELSVSIAQQQEELNINN